jgi:hypothetical protein
VFADAPRYGSPIAKHSLQIAEQRGIDLTRVIHRVLTPT